MVALFSSDGPAYRPLISSPRSLSSKLIAVLAVLSVIYTARFLFPEHLSFSAFLRPRASCAPRDWAAGKWVPKPPPTNRTDFAKEEDAWEFLGLQGCASTREIYWHLAADAPRLYDRFPGVSSWRWQPSSRCDIDELDPAVLVKDLVEQGGWFLVGDSVTENHFFSLSCLLYPHVRATPDYVANPYFDRGWPQNLYLNPDSPLIPHLRLPAGFDVATTPLVTFRRIDLLYETRELDALYHSLHPDSPYLRANESVFSDEAVWTMSPEQYVREFTAPLPQGNYATMVASTGGHWTTTMLAGLKDTQLFHDGVYNVVSFFREAMDAWARDVQSMLRDAEVAERHSRSRKHREERRPPRQVVVRAYLPGHEDCHNFRAPIGEYTKGVNGWYNWNQIGDFNRAIESVLESRHYPDIHFLPIDRPALLRPDAHASGDCLHFMTGAGVLEGWTHYVWHFVTVELPGRMR